MLLARIAQRMPAHAPLTALNTATGTIGLSALAFASAAGMSVWVSATAALAVAVWTIDLLVQRRLAIALAIVLSGAIALALALPYLRELLAYRTGEGLPIAFEIRTFPVTDAVLQAPLAIAVARLAALPVSYLIELGILLVGAILYWLRPTPALPQAGRDMRQLLMITASTGLFVATFLKSTIVNNDLAWRAILFTQVVAVLWSTVAIAQIVVDGRLLSGETVKRLPAALVLTGLLGFFGVVYDLAGLRLYHAFGLVGEADMDRDARIDHDIRAAYVWLSRHDPRPRVVQHNPDAERAFGYGLYGRTRVAVSDRHNGRLFGAPADAVMSRVADLKPIFAGSLPPSDARQRLAALDVDAIVVTSADPIWADRSAWIWRAAPLYASERVRIVPVDALKP
jgi:hypothetical protein